MDSLTQIVLGAAVAEAVAGRKMGGKAALYGALAGTIPDLDVFVGNLYHPVEAALVHRGVSHSLLFALLVGPALGWIFFKLYRERYELKTWIWLWFLSIVTHPMLDMFTNYGTQFLWPFDFRITFNTVFVIDPLYTLPFMICLLVALFIKRDNPLRRNWNNAGLIFSSLYLMWGVVVKLTILNSSPAYFEKAGISSRNHMVTPMPLTSFYWMMLSEDDRNYYVGYKSLFYKFDANDVDTIAKKRSDLNKVKWPDKDYTADLKYFSNGYYTTERNGDTLIFYDLRFGVLSKITNQKVKKPLMGFGMVIDKDRVHKTIRYRGSGMREHLNFGSYINKIFYK